MKMTLKKKVRVTPVFDFEGAEVICYRISPMISFGDIFVRITLREFFVSQQKQGILSDF